MKENIAGKVGRIISGGFNALVDVIEHLAPEAVMEQALREIDGVTEEVRAQLGKVIANKHLASKRIAEENRVHEELSEKIEIALREGREDLASAAIERQLDIEAQIPVLEKNLIDRSEEEKELEGYILALQAKKREMKSELAAYREVTAEKNIPLETSPGTEDTGLQTSDKRVHNAISAFDRIIEKETGAGTLHALDSSDQANKLAELEKLARENRVSERLAEMKAKL
jgi:phage shock protein A